MLKILTLILLSAFVLTKTADAQTPTKTQTKTTENSKKANQRPAVAASEPFDKADVKTLLAQCVRLETEAGVIELEMFPETAPETVRNFLNLAAIGAFDTTTFSRVVPGFVIQGGNFSTRQKMSDKLTKRSYRTIADEPNAVKHTRGIVSMARPETPNSATSHFFILLRDAANLDGTFAAFGRVTSGMDIVEAINKMPVEDENPVKPVRITRAAVVSCPVQTDR